MDPRVTSSEHGLIFSNHRWSITVQTEPGLSPSRVEDLVAGVALADERYCYQLTLEPTDQGFAGGVRSLAGIRFVGSVTSQVADVTELTLTGRLDFGLTGPTDVFLEHLFRLPASGDWLEEQLTLIHRFGRDRHRLGDLRFGMRKTLYDRDRQRWSDHADRFRLIPVPDRRWRGQAIDHRLDGYAASDLIPGSWGPSQLPDRAAEAWLWTDGSAGYLIAKHNPGEVEYAVVDGEFVVSRSKRDDAYYGTFVARVAGGSDVCLRFAGAGRHHLCPESAAELGPEPVSFGVTHIEPFTGDWQRGYGAYKRFLVGVGYTCPEAFDPPLHWNELYNLGWRGGDNAPLQERSQLIGEARLAAAVGAEALYLDPVWDVLEGTTIWDEARLGPLPEFVREVAEDHGLKTSLHLMMHTKSLDEDPMIYRRRRDGSIDPWDDLYRGGRICAASPAWQAMKTERLLALAEAGVTFFMFDFLNYAPANAALSGRAEGEACWSPDHGHPVPLPLEGHARGILQVVRNVKERYPDVLIECHDPLTGGLQDFVPLYYQMDRPGSYDEHWGFEYMWDPYMDLLSGKALSLYEYNLAYDIPLYLHIHCGQDNERQLAFWWYASTCRHLGIGGVSDADPERFGRLREAVQTYRRIKPLLARGRFLGIDRQVHGHVARDGSGAAFVLFNLSGDPVRRNVDVELDDIGLSGSVRAADGVEVGHGRLRFSRTLPPLSPTVVEVTAPAPD